MSGDSAGSGTGRLAGSGTGRLAGSDTGRLAGKVAVITGAARGQGEAEARLFAREGASVVATDLFADLVAGVAADIVAGGGSAIGLEHDASDAASWDAVIAAATERFGGVDILVNNAAIHWIRPLAAEEQQDLRRMLDVNLIGPILGMQRAAVAMQARGGGSIVNISSYAGLRGAYGHGAYGASKWGLRGVTKVAAIEYGPAGIRVNSVHPGPIDTAMLPVAEGDFAAHFADVPLKRVGRAQEVAELALFLASDAASYLSGSEISVDGGIIAGRLPDGM
jgi:3alpha(or 20beta)-hydroxysteroid dehydrogenase